MNNHTNLEVANAVSKQFPSTSVESLAKAISQYKAIGAWNYNLQPTEQSYNKLQDILANSGELTSRVDFNKIVNLAFAQEVFK